MTCSFLSRSSLGKKCPLSYLLCLIFLPFLIFHGITVFDLKNSSLCFATFLFFTMTLLFFPFSPQWNIVQLYQEELVMVLLLAGNFPVRTASVAPVQNNLMVFMRRSCTHKLKSSHATSINALLLFLISNLQGTLVMDHSLYSGWNFGRKESSTQQIELISEWEPWLYICYWGTNLTKSVEIVEAENITYNAQESEYFFLPPLQWREKQTLVKLKATIFELITWSRFTYFQFECGACSHGVSLRLRTGRIQKETFMWLTVTPRL